MFYAVSKIKYGKPDAAKMFAVARMEKLQRGPAPPSVDLEATGADEETDSDVAGLVRPS